MSYIEKMRKELNINNSLRTYFDSGSHEFNQTNYQEKIETLARIISSDFDLEKVIKEYKKNYSGEGYKHVYGNVKRTFVFLISFIKTGESIDPETIMNLQSKSEEEVISLFISDVREKVLPHEGKS
jgi:lipopolysaccharide biosynthesis regulator YciM